MREHESREPFAYIIQDKYERERGVEGHLSRSHVSKYVSQEDINEHEITCTPLYRHAQPVPVVSAELLHTAASAIEDLLTTKGRMGAYVWFDLPFRLRSAANAQPAPVVPKSISVRQAISALESADAVTTIGQAYKMGWNACRAAMLNQAQEPSTYNTAPQPAVVSDEMIDTFEAEFRSAFKVSPEVKQMLEIGYHGEKFSFSIRDAATWWKLGRAAMLAAAPQLPGSEPATVPGKWIPVSERMPEEGGRYWCYVEEQNSLGKNHYQWNCSWNGDVWSDKALTGRVTHWMPLPSAPQEVKGE